MKPTTTMASSALSMTNAEKRACPFSCVTTLSVTKKMIPRTSTPVRFIIAVTWGASRGQICEKRVLSVKGTPGYNPYRIGTRPDDH